MAADDADGSDEPLPSQPQRRPVSIGHAAGIRPTPPPEIPRRLRQVGAMRSLTGMWPGALASGGGELAAQLAETAQGTRSPGEGDVGPIVSSAIKGFFPGAVHFGGLATGEFAPPVIEQVVRVPANAFELNAINAAPNVPGRAQRALAKIQDLDQSLRAYLLREHPALHATLYRPTFTAALEAPGAGTYDVPEAVQGPGRDISLPAETRPTPVPLLSPARVVELSRKMSPKQMLPKRKLSSSASLSKGR